MKSRMKNILICVAILTFLTGMGGWLLLKTPQTYSLSERRVLATKVDASLEKVLNGKFMTETEDYALDQFPLRDGFRSIKAMAEHFVFAKKDSNGIYLEDGYLSKTEYPLNEKMLERSLERIQGIDEKYLKKKGITPYLVIIPDKNYYLAKEHQILSMDYEKLYEKTLARLDEMKYIEIRDLLDIQDYYYTDTHWRQECIQKVAGRIGESMENPLKASYETVTLDIPFYGVYVGQLALPVKPDVIKYLTNDMLTHCIVTNYDTGKSVETEVYDKDKAAGKDPYEMFLSGATAILTIENSQATSDKELVVFRDSFGSSLVPLLVENYSKITLVDLRYIQSDMVGNFVDFENQDVLFVYSSLLLNTGLGGGN